MHLVLPLHVSVVVNRVFPVVLFLKFEVVTIDLAVDIERANIVLTCAIDPGIVDNHRQGHVVSKPILIVMTVPVTRAIRVSLNCDCVNFSHLNNFLGE